VKAAANNEKLTIAEWDDFVLRRLADADGTAQPPSTGP